MRKYKENSIYFKSHLLLIIVSVTFSILISTGCKDEEKKIPPPEVFLKVPEAGFEIESGDTIYIEPRITYDYGSSYRWYHNNSMISRDKTLKITGDKLGRNEYLFIVDNSQGSDSLLVDVATIILIDFNEFELEDESHYTGYDSDKNRFISNGVNFPVNPSSNDEWTGFALSNKYSRSVTSTPDLFSAYTPASADDNFMLYYQPPSAYAASLSFEEGIEHLIESFSIANSTFNAILMQFGTENGIPRFGGESNNKPDWFKVVFEGYDKEGKKTGEKEFYLADYRFDNNMRNYIVNNWSTIKTEELGKVNRVAISLYSSLTDSEGVMLTPPFVCINNMKILE
ncbi:DUF4465 domain-containing protein [Marinilabiliaceae bacterium ANBcel2]|nr:DUF4465 domain-containing protein [Marinilabiliaceae bacterium ANBcel2]